MLTEATVSLERLRQWNKCTSEVEDRVMSIYQAKFQDKLLR